MEIADVENGILSYRDFPHETIFSNVWVFMRLVADLESTMCPIG